MTRIPVNLGSYRVTRELGRGGMGVVYLARDSRLDREVAMKALPTELGADPARLERFEREAKTLAQLNHPNLVGIYGVEEQDGARYLVLEYVAGETLADRLDRGPLPVDEAVEYAVQIAAGLEAAHEAGVIHRDLKPANVIITPDGKAKVLDFGLARTDEGGQSSSGGPDSPTITTPQPQHSPTIAGAILGTAAYMSPEQARGRRVDKRTDIWSFGVVLYEMLTGASPFHGETATDSIGAVLHKDLDLDQLPPQAGPQIRRVLRRCLVRDRNERYRDIGDVRIELLAPSETADTESGQKTPHLRPRDYAVAGLLAVIAALGVWFLKPVPSTPDLPVVDASIELPDGEMLAHAYSPALAISPDGRSVVFASCVPPEVQRSVGDLYFQGGLRLRRVGSSIAVPIPGAEANSLQPAFSPDGSELVFLQDSRIMRLPLQGGEPSLIVELEAPTFGLCWSQDGYVYFGSGLDGVQRVPASGGSSERLTLADNVSEDVRHYHPHVVPGGHAVLFTKITSSSLKSGMTIWMYDLKSGETRQLMSNGSQPSFLDGQLLFVRDGVLWAAPFDLQVLKVTGPARSTGIQVVHAVHVPNWSRNNGSAQYAVSRSGSLVYAEGGIFPPIYRRVAWVDPQGTATKIDLEHRAYGAVRLSPDADRMAVAIMRGAASAVWVHDFLRGVSRLVYRSSELFWPVWGPGDDEITITENTDDGGTRIGWLRIGAAESTIRWIDMPDGLVAFAADWSPDRRHLVCVVTYPDDRWSLASWNEESGWVRITDVAPYENTHPALSPDGKWLAYSSEESGRDEIYVRPFLRDGPSIQVTQGGALSPMWADDMSELLFLIPDDAHSPSASFRLGAVPVTKTADSVNFGRTEERYDATEFSTSNPLRVGDLAPDGRLLTTIRAPADEFEKIRLQMHPATLRYVQNWAARLRERDGS